MIFHRVKEAAARTVAAGDADTTTSRQFADEVRDLASRYGDLKFAGTLRSATDNLFTFLMYPGVHPDNNVPNTTYATWWS